MSTQPLNKKQKNGSNILSSKIDCAFACVEFDPAALT